MTIIREIMKGIYILGLFVVLTVFFVVLDNLFHLGLTSAQGMATFIVPLILVLTSIIGFPVLRKDFSNRFLAKKNDIFQSICLPILFGIVATFVVNIVRFIPYWIGGHDPIGVGSNQVTTLEGFSKVGEVVSKVVIGPFNEEVIFRYLLYGGVFLLFKEIPSHQWLKWLKGVHNRLFIEKSSIYIVAWVLLTNVWFAMSHGPDLWNFPLYFFAGVINALFFLKYGFLSAWISHGAFNLFSGILLELLFSNFL